jgi:RNA polymerase sigma-70 factor (ECF subfamily)
MALPAASSRAALGSAAMRARGSDDASRAWVAALRATGPARERAVGELHALMLRAARFELQRRRALLRDLSATDLEDLAQQSASDAVVAVLSKLDRYAGQSRFTTWAYKFALLEAGSKARRRSWQGRELPLLDDGLRHLADATAGPGATAGTAQLLRALAHAIVTGLTPHQRDVLVALTLQDVPVDVLAERLGTTRGAVYKTLHDARCRLRRALAEQGLDPDDLDDA